MKITIEDVDGDRLEVEHLESCFVTVGPALYDDDTPAAQRKKRELEQVASLDLERLRTLIAVLQVIEHDMAVHG